MLAFPSQGLENPSALFLADQGQKIAFIPKVPLNNLTVKDDG
jgi:hypothetical protein